jgi:hypothetical protein
MAKTRGSWFQLTKHRQLEEGKMMVTADCPQFLYESQTAKFA